MQGGSPSALFRYGGAVVAIAVATGLRFWLDSVLEGAGLGVFFIALVIAGWYGRVGPFLLAFFLSLASFYLFFPPAAGSVPEPPARVIVGLGAFFFVGLATALLSESVRAAQRRAEAQTSAALYQREQMRTTLSCIGEAVIVTDTSGTITMMNPVAERLTGWRAVNATGRPIQEVFRMSDENSGERMDSPVDRVFRHRIMANTARPLLLESRYGKRRPIDYSAAPIQDANGSTTGVVLIFRDVTSRRQSEQALRDADRRKDEFLALLAHELRNPLAPIGNALQILEMTEDDDSATNARQMMQRQFGHLVRLVDDLLDVSRIARGKIELRPERSTLGAVLERAVEAARPLIDSRKHELILDVPAHPLELYVDPIRLAQVVTNLLTNAAKFTEEEGSIIVTARSEGDDLVLRVRDTGIGIAATLLPRVFDMFMQVEEGRTRSHGGLGIGLTLVRSIVQMHGGDVEARSDGPGKGSEFIVRLPREQVPAAEPKPVTPVLATEAPRKSILIVDDNVDAAGMLASLLQSRQHDVATAFNGPAALDRALEVHPEAVILDLGMPGMDGCEVAEKLRAREGGDALVLIALTGWGGVEDRQRTMAAGFDYHFVKPARVEELEFAIAQGRVKQPAEVSV